MQKIIGTSSLDSGYIDIHLKNGSTIIFDLNVLSERPEIAALLQSNAWAKPKTDGDAVWWQDGPRLTLEDFLQRLGEERPDKGGG